MNEKTDILLHTCCGPCLEWPAQQFMAEKQKLLIWFYNPNIQPLAEQQRRLANLQILAAKLNLQTLIEPGCEPEVWQSWDSPTETRCRMCYRRRLSAAAEKARELCIPAFSTTLLVSPWQDQEAIIEIGHAAGLAAGVQFIDRDFRDGYKEGQRLAREDGLYRQRYCGCLPSIEQSNYREQIMQDLAAISEQPSRSDNDHK